MGALFVCSALFLLMESEEPDSNSFFRKGGARFRFRPKGISQKLWDVNFRRVFTNQKNGFKPESMSYGVTNICA